MSTKTFRIEKDVKKEVKRLLDQHGWFWWMPPANGFGKPNVDFNALREGVFLAVETKFGSNKPSVNQKAFCENVMGNDGIALCVNEKTIAVFAVWLQAFDNVRAAISKTGDQKGARPEDGATLFNAQKIMTDMLITA